MFFFSIITIPVYNKFINNSGSCILLIDFQLMRVFFLQATDMIDEADKDGTGELDFDEFRHEILSKQ